VLVEKPSLTYKSSDTSVATVSSDGILKPYKAGNVTITATWEDGNNIQCITDITITKTESSSTTTTPSTANVYCTISSSTNEIKVGGSYRLLTANLINEDTEEDVTSDYSDTEFLWSLSSGVVDPLDVTWSTTNCAFNQIRIEIADNSIYYGETITIRCEVGNKSASKIFNLVSFN
jgi:hypothetical protein